MKIQSRPIEEQFKDLVSKECHLYYLSITDKNNKKDGESQSSYNSEIVSNGNKIAILKAKYMIKAIKLQ